MGDNVARKKTSSAEKEGSWLDTYGDMVTLLLTFFVMLYASSSFDEGKWQYILQAFTSRGDIMNPVVAPENPDSNTDQPFVSDQLGDGELPQTFDELYQYLVNYVDNNNLAQSVEVEKGASNIYLKFRDDIFFLGDSDNLLDQGKTVLDGISGGIKAVDDQIMGVRVCGHTAKSEFSVVDDAELAAGRAVSVLNYLVHIQACKPSKMVSAGYGEYRPIADNDTEENRAKNRRVEIIIIRKDADLSDPAVIDELLKMDYGAEYVTPDYLLNGMRDKGELPSEETTESTQAETTDNN